MSSMRIWRRPSPAFIIAILALFLAVGGTSDAAGRTHFLKLGKTSKTSGATALVSRSRKHPALALKSTRVQPAASFVTPKGVTPFTVDQTTKVANLNADLLDGLDSSVFQRAVSGTCASGSAIRAIDSGGTVTCATFPSIPTIPSAWLLGGNAGTTAANNFLGTTDNQPLVVRTNNREALRVTAAGNLGVGQSSPTARVDAVAGTGQTAVSGSSTSGIAITATSTGNNALVANSTGGIGVLGISNSRGLVGTLGTISCPGTYAVGACGGATSEGLLADSTTRGVVGTLSQSSCPGTYAVGGCGGTTGDGVLG